MSRLKKITFFIHPCIPAGQMSRKRVYTIVILKAVTTSTHKELCIVYLQRSKPKCIRIQQSILPSSYISTNVIVTNVFFFLLPFHTSLFPLPSLFPCSLILSLSLLVLFQVFESFSNTWKCYKDMKAHSA